MFVHTYYIPTEVNLLLLLSNKRLIFFDLGYDFAELFKLFEIFAILTKIENIFVAQVLQKCGLKNFVALSFQQSDKISVLDSKNQIRMD